MSHFIDKKLISCLLMSTLLLGFGSYLYSAEPHTKHTAECAYIKYIPRNPQYTINNVDIYSVSKFSLAKINRGWMVFDHIGYKDTAFQGERHLAYMGDGVQFFGYDIEPLTDLCLLQHPDGENQTINMLQAPVRADWHTLNGNGLLFGCTFSGGEPNTDYDLCSNEGNVSVTGYSVVATADKIQVRQYSGVSAVNIGDDGAYGVLYEEPKECPGQNITVEIIGNHAKVFLDSRMIFEFDLSGQGRGTGMVTTYKEHCCSSLSSIYMFNHTVNGIDYLKPNK